MIRKQELIIRVMGMMIKMGASDGVKKEQILCAIGLLSRMRSLEAVAAVRTSSAVAICRYLLGVS